MVDQGDVIFKKNCVARVFLRDANDLVELARAGHFYTSGKTPVTTVPIIREAGLFVLIVTLLLK